MEKENKEIPFGAKDSELYKFEYSIPEGYEARIEDGKVIIERKESEDERIRKEIVNFICWAIERGSITNEQRGRSVSWLAYLEKQKEQKPNPYSGTGFDYSGHYWGMCARDGGVEIIVDGKIRDRVFFESENIERSDSVAKDMFIKALERTVEQTKKGYELTDCDKHSWWEDFKAYSGIKPAEWSEEDAGMLNCIIATLCEESHGGREANEKMVTWLENRLKSLRPRSNWKPSKKQINMLGAIVEREKEKPLYGIDGYSPAAVLESLYNDLKKLK